MLINIDLISSSSGTIHSNITSLKSISSSSIIKAGSFVIDNSVFNFSSLVDSISIKSTSHKSFAEFVTLFNNSLDSFQVQKIFIFIIKKLII
jgi:hypothetical protein